MAFVSQLWPIQNRQIREQIPEFGLDFKSVVNFERKYLIDKEMSFPFFPLNIQFLQYCSND